MGHPQASQSVSSPPVSDVSISTLLSSAREMRPDRKPSSTPLSIQPASSQHNAILIIPFLLAFTVP